jgi:hypothetical protein
LTVQHVLPPDSSLPSAALPFPVTAPQVAPLPVVTAAPVTARFNQPQHQNLNQNQQARNNPAKGKAPVNVQGGVDRAPGLKLLARINKSGAAGIPAKKDQLA